MGLKVVDQEKLIKARLKFAREYLKHGDEFWKSVLWFEETKLELLLNMFGEGW